MFYDGNLTLTHNCLFNFIIGNRGGGKTYWSKKWAIKDFLKTGKQFVYVRRYDTEFNHKDSFFADIKEEFPNHDMVVKGYKLYIDKKECGQFLALSKAKIEKSNSFPNVNKIIFDEFILDKGCYHYLADEVTNFLDLYETVARSRDDVRVFFLSNAITVTNPYFLYFKINIEGISNIKKFNGDMLVELVQNKEFIEMKKNTRFGKLINDTQYGKYAIDNNFLRDSRTFLERKNGQAKFHFILKYKGLTYGVWLDYQGGKYFVSNNIDESCKLVYSLTMEDHEPNTMLLKGSQSRFLKTFFKNYQMGNVYFENMNIKNNMYEIFRLALI